MARPKDADSERTFNTIVDAALELLAECAAPAPSLRKVAKKANVSLATIQYYFGSKEELLEACLDGYYGRLTAAGGELMALAEQGATGRALIEQAVGALYDFHYRERAMMALRVATNAQRGELHPRRQVEFMAGLAVQAARAMQPHVEVELMDARFSVQAVATMIVRFVLMSDSELTHLTGLEGEASRAAARDYVVRAARRLVRPSDG